MSVRRLGPKGGELGGYTLIGERNECQCERWALKGVNQCPARRLNPEWTPGGVPAKMLGPEGGVDCGTPHGWRGE